MKKITAMILAVLMAFSVSVIFAGAEETAPETAEVYVTISDKDGKLAMAAEKVQVTDIDGDNALTVNDALYCAHEQSYEGGAEAGYASEITKYGLSLTKLWGTANGYSYGYMVNNVSAWSLTDAVKTDDYVAAYVFTDTTGFSDKYSFFDKLNVELTEETTLELTLTKNDFDQDWNPLTVPVEGAEITLDGEASGVITDAEGKATVTFTSNKKYIVSATASGQVIVPPVCAVTVTSVKDEPTSEPETTVEPTTADETSAQDETAAPTQAATSPSTKDEATKDSASGNAAPTSTPATGDTTNLWLWILLAGLCLCGVVGLVAFYDKRYVEK